MKWPSKQFRKITGVASACGIEMVFPIQLHSKRIIKSAIIKAIIKSIIKATIKAIIKSTIKTFIKFIFVVIVQLKASWSCSHAIPPGPVVIERLALRIVAGVVFLQNRMAEGGARVNYAVNDSFAFEALLPEF